MKTNSIDKIIKIFKNKLDIEILQLSKIEIKLQNLQNEINDNYQSMKKIVNIPLNIIASTNNTGYIYKKITILKEQCKKNMIYIKDKKSEILTQKLKIEKFNIIKEKISKTKKEKINKKNLQEIDEQFTRKLYNNE